MARQESLSVKLCDEVQVGRIVFSTISQVASVELPKIEAELVRQLDVILRLNQQTETDEQDSSHTGELSANTASKMKHTIGQLFLHLQRVLVLNIAQSLSERLVVSINEMALEAKGIEKDNKELSKEVAHLRESLSYLSERIKENSKNQDLSGKTKGETEGVGYQEISMSVDRLIARTHQMTEMLTELSRRYSELREESSRNKQTRSI